MLNITRRILNAVLALHRKNIFRSIDAAERSTNAAFFRAENQRRVADIELDRADELTAQAYDIQDDNIVIQVELQRELKKLPEVYPS